MKSYQIVSYFINRMTSTTSTSISKEILKFVKDHRELENSANSINPIILGTFKEVYTACCEDSINKIDKLKIDSIVDYLNEQLHMGHWSIVPLTTKEAFYSSSFLKAVVLLQLDNRMEVLHEALKCIDMGILLGSPLERNRDLLTDAAKCINGKLGSRIDENREFGKSNKRSLESFSEYDGLKGVEVPSKSLPSLECFMKEFYNKQMPVKIQDSISHWPALQKWMDISYILNIAGERTVPVEIGSQYSDENWSQKLMTVKDFVQNYYLSESKTIGYLAQHNLLDQIPELKDDIRVPEYCYTSRNSNEDDPSVEINAWFGPKGTISSMHFDPKDNLLSQVYGTKLVILFSPSDTQYLYPHQDQMLCNTSQVNPIKADLEKFPKFLNANMMKCLLEPGDILYIPPKWWHYVVALEKSFSVNFWWT